MTDALLTRVAVALHGVTPPDPEGALALHRDAAARVVAALGDEGLRARVTWFGSAPISAPVWMWLAYGAIIIALGVMAGSLDGFAFVWFSAAFSFQFWTFATWRGYTRRALTTEPTP